MRKRTTTKQLNTAITNNLLRVTKAEIHYKSSRRIDEISKETLTENFGFLCESGCFMDAIGWYYERNYKTGDYEIECGRMNPETEVIVTVYLNISDGVSREDVERMLEIVEEE